MGGGRSLSRVDIEWVRRHAGANVAERLKRQQTGRWCSCKDICRSRSSPLHHLSFVVFSLLRTRTPSAELSRSARSAGIAPPIIIGQTEVVIRRWSTDLACQAVPDVCFRGIRTGTTRPTCRATFLIEDRDADL